MINEKDVQIANLIQQRLDFLLDGYRDNRIQEETISGFLDWLHSMSNYAWTRMESIRACNKVANFPGVVDLEVPRRGRNAPVLQVAGQVNYAGDRPQEEAWIAPPRGYNPEE